MKEDLVLSIGGSILIPEDDNASNIKDLARVIIDASKDKNLYLVVGGGKTARRYINWGRDLGANEASLDDLGIETSRLNARLLIIALGKSVYSVPAKNFDEAVSAGNHYPIVTMGGTHPGHTTDAVAAMLAERLHAKRMINVTSVDGVYTADPKKDPNAEKIESMDYDKLIGIVSKGERGAGPNIVFDPLAAKIIKRADITTQIVSGYDLDNLRKVMENEEFTGTTVSSI